MSWLSGTTVIGTPVQGNLHTWNNGVTLTIANDINPAPVVVMGGTVEWYADPVLLSLMNPSSQRNPLATARLPIQPGFVNPGCVMRVPVPQGPPTARYSMFTVNMGDQQGQPATMDFLQLPLDAASQPIIHSATAAGGMLTLMFPTIPDRSYRLQSSPDLRPDSFFDVFVDLMGDGSDMSLDVPLNGAQSFYRIMLDPE